MIQASSDDALLMAFVFGVSFLALSILAFCVSSVQFPV
jgi:hypothetical protein